MTRTHVGHTAGNVGRITVSGSERDRLARDVGDATEVDVGDDTIVSHARIDSNDFDRFRSVSPSN